MKVVDVPTQITINRPQKRNAFRPQTTEEMMRCFSDARDDPSIGVIILTGDLKPPSSYPSCLYTFNLSVAPASSLYQQLGINLHITLQQKRGNCEGVFLHREGNGSFLQRG